MSEETPQHVDVAFPAYGESLPLDHGFPLYAALSRIVPRLHGAEDWGVHPVLGERANHSTLALTDQSRVILRVPANDLGACVVLVGADLEVNGHRLRLGSPRLDRLRPVAAIKG